MKKLVNFLVIASLFIPILSQSVNKDLVKKNLTHIASDEMMGRDAATEGERMASDFIAAELKKYGVKPFGDEGTYFQNFNLNAVKVELNSKMKIGDINLDLGKDFFLFGNKPVNVKKINELVFVGYGITADEHEYDDYSDVEVEGKSVLISLGEPYSENDEFFNGHKESKYSSFRYKIQNATKKGASEIILLPENIQQQQMYWQYLAGSVGKESLQRISTDDKPIQIFVLSFDVKKSLH